MGNRLGKACGPPPNKVQLRNGDTSHKTASNGRMDVGKYVSTVRQLPVPRISLRPGRRPKLTDSDMQILVVEDTEQDSIGERLIEELRARGFSNRKGENISKKDLPADDSSAPKAQQADDSSLREVPSADDRWSNAEDKAFIDDKVFDEPRSY
ncbi:uncharacterized protein LOC127879880 isoform X2 [Dreissena polymorpha]|uniref:uncharacterized protein LOC127879880 isoform X2 n=1 Tax=Dreissena polymorpha TaxID=45954 RepID=UPI002264BC09|nr:uncharacterized protein LOC127879880 isoform X2 [Dreissena polymorpha]